MRARIVGDWTLAHYAALRREVQRLRARIDERSQIELSGLGALDTAGAGLLVELL
ncbi:MAG TPA: ABC transporter permease, partial [Pseudomonas sp.]|nr:ABC transporter permease [Pseudomonas sp.]